jgi:hypothetical protein
MAQVASCRSLKAKTGLYAQVNPHGICGGQSGTGTGFPPSPSVLPINIIPPWFFILVYHPENER